MNNEPIYKKYIVFAWEQYYPLGGLNDIKAEYDSLNDARDYLIHLGNDEDIVAAKIVYRDTWHILDKYARDDDNNWLPLFDTVKRQGDYD